ncbi:DHA2 family efflux MFS transporter permease subunit [Streptomyces carpaticus]|uniref:Drug resistance transporter, EmrB/QacA subfamily n=2 Tax=Streptomyces TaxID=1883 RepID=A0A1I6V7L1_9ACTN|nr:MFS transporter [Streptomyces harbinensis]QKV68885.1 MFS transporter [Streptomyces harbinensis]UWM49546.1 DHA2 family efflux MFS transporter permease subunit [Streptomyces carpaticus]SFT09610.1 drug resistance transporter, EmrB/QacA subfamily [Streptomyces harbinensis]
MPPDSTQTAPAPAPGALDPRRWRILAFIAIAQLMVVLDATIVNIALPSAQVDLGLSDGNRQWVITAYALAFGGLLLFGGRIADLWGRRNAFITGLVGFAIASALGGAASNAGLLFASRALQGVFAALLAPAALSLLTVLFTEARERAKAFGIFGAIAGAGGAVGLLLGGVLTEYLDWRWTFYVNIPFAAVAIAGAVALIKEPEGARNRSPLDLPGVVLATTGLVALVYGFSRAEEAGWGDGLTIGMFVAAAVLLVSFVAVEARVKHPLLPLRVVLDRNRGGAYAATGIAVIGMFGLFLFLTFYMQLIKEYSPVVTGLAFLPMVAGMITGSTQIATRLMLRVPPRLLMVPGYLVAAVGMLLLTQIGMDTSYPLLILPAMLLIGLGLGTAMMPAMQLATGGVQPADAGIASAMVNTSQQVGGAIGTALLNTIAASATTSYIAARTQLGMGEQAQGLLALEGQVHGFTRGIWWAFGILLLSAAIAGVLINGKGPAAHKAAAAGEEEGEPVPVLAH